MDPELRLTVVAGRHVLCGPHGKGPETSLRTFEPEEISHTRVDPVWEEGETTSIIMAVRVARVLLRR